MNRVKKISYCFVIIAALFSPAAHCQNMRNLMIVLDTHKEETPETKSFAMTKNIICALTDKTYPFAISPLYRAQRAI